MNRGGSQGKVQCPSCKGNGHLGEATTVARCVVGMVE